MTWATGHRGPVWGAWWGGPSYSPPDWTDVERFDSISAARDEMESRYSGWCTTGRSAGLACPGVESDEMAVFYADPATYDSEPYPDLILSRGPRGGIRQERC